MKAHRMVFGVLGATVIAIACSSTTNDPSTAGQPGPGADGLVDGGGVVPTVNSSDGGATDDAADAQVACEELGDLSASGLVASYDATSRWFTGGLTGRPVLTELSVVAVGAPADLQGNLVALGVGPNANYATCTHCMLLLVGCTADNCSSAKQYFAESGNAYLNQVATGPGQPFVGQFADVTLREVTVDANLTSTNVAGGACFHLSSFGFSATTAAAAVNAGDGGDAGGSGGSGGSGGGTVGTGSSGRGAGAGGARTPPPIGVESPDGGSGSAGSTADGGAGGGGVGTCGKLNAPCSGTSCCAFTTCNPVTHVCGFASVPPLK